MPNYDRSQKLTNTLNQLSIGSPIVYSNHYDGWIDETKDQERNKNKKHKIYEFDKYITEAPVIRSKTSGEERFLQFEALLENGFPWKRHIFQVEFHDKAAMVLAEYLVGEDWTTVGPNLINERKWTQEMNTKMFLASTARRLGKSIACGMLAAAVALTKPNSKQAIFSTSQRIAGYLGEICHTAIYHHKPECIKKYGEEW